jgi:cell wall-associated NlpC family hydrolase
MRRNWLASAVLTAAALSVPVATMSATAQAATKESGQQKTVAKKHYAGKHRRPETFDQVAAALAKTLVGDPYQYGGTSPAGFDCSGLTRYVYRHTGHGKPLRRTAEDQFLELRPVSHRHAKPGDLVFFHETSNPRSSVYHVGVYEGGDDMVAATTSGESVQFQNFSWAGDTITFGTIAG